MSRTAVHTNSQGVDQAIAASEENAIEIAAEATSPGIKVLCIFYS